MRDTVKTFAGLVIIALIVVATFVYGNSQRQSQLKHDQQVKQQQASVSGQSPAASTKPSVAPTVASSAGSQPQSNGSGTAPVESPKANSVQGNGSTIAPTPVVTPKPTSIPSPAQVAANTGSTSTAPLPQTGSPLGGLIGVAALIGAIVALRHSRQAVLAAARSHRSL
jgi:cytoskeletal protein RodZ